jgi:hypothetical protein
MVVNLAGAPIEVPDADTMIWLLTFEHYGPRISRPVSDCLNVAGPPSPIHGLPHQAHRRAVETDVGNLRIQC